MIWSSHPRRYLLAVLAAAAGLLALDLFPTAFRTAPLFPAAVVAFLTLLLLGIGPALVAQGMILLGTLGLLLVPDGRLVDPQVPLGGRIGLTIALFGLVDAVAWRVERVRKKKALRERALYENETRYRHILEQASDGIVVGSLESGLILVNQRICEMLGYSQAELLHMPIESFYAKGELEQSPLAWEELQRTSVVVRERRLRRKDGSTFLAELSVRLTADGLAQAIVRDITERKRAEEELRTQHTLLESIVATSVAGLLVITREGGIVYLNPAAEAALGVTRGELENRIDLPPGWRLLTLDGKPVPRDELPPRRVLETGEPVVDARLIVERPSGEQRILVVNATPLADAAGEVSAVVLSLSDITREQLSQHAIRKSEEQLQRVAAAVPGVVYQYVVGPGDACRFSYMSERAAALFGVPAAEIVADPSRWWEIVEPADREAATRAFRAVGKALEPRSFDFRVRSAGPQVRWLRDIATAERGEPGAAEPSVVVWNGVIIDITEQKLLEEKLLQSQKMDSLGRLAGGVAHDFNNLLTVIRGYADVLTGELSSEDPRHAEVREIRRAADRATSLTRQLLAMSRRQVLVPREVDLNVLVLEIERMLRRVIGEHIRIVTEPGSELGWVRSDAGQLEQVLLNLAVNARDAMPGGGTLTIATARMVVQPGDEEAATRGVAPGDYVVLRVADTGVGMDRETQSKIFEPFFTTKPVGEGTGLGLSTVYGIVQQSGGAITVVSERGVGTTFRVFLPRLGERAGTGGDAEVRSPAFAAGERQPVILLVEDDESVRQLTARILCQYGYDYLLAQDGAEALALLGDEALGVDAVVSDVVMPGMSGAELVGKLRARWPELPVLYLSGYTGDEVKGSVRPGSRQGFLQKPFSPDALAAALEELLSDTRPPATAG